MTRMARTMAISSCLALAGSGLSWGQVIEAPDWENSVRFDLVASQDRVRPGDDFELAVVAEIDPGYHLYGPEERKPSRTEVVVEGELIRSDQPVFPPVIRRDLSGLGEYDLYEGKIAIRLPVTLEEEAASREEISISVRVNYQVCTDMACSAPTHRTFAMALPVVEKGAAVEAMYPRIFDSKE